MAISIAEVDEVKIPKGYPREILGENVELKFICSLCHLILRNPVQSHCGHRFCYDCAEVLIRNEKDSRCPMCIQELQDNGEDLTECAVIRKENTFPDNAIKRDLSKKEAQCIMHGAGCPWKNLFKDLEKHLEECTFMMSTCPDCGSKINYGEAELSKHKKSGCLKAGSVCPFGCGEKIGRDVNDHMSSYTTEHFLYINERLRDLETRTMQSSKSLPGNSPLNEKITKIETEVKNLKEQMKSYQYDPVRRTSTAGSNSEGPEKYIEGTSLVSSGYGSMTDSLKIYEGTLVVINKEIDRLCTQIESLQKSRESESKRVLELEAKMKSMEIRLTTTQGKVMELQMKVSYLESASYDGTLLWKITDFQAKRRQAKTGEVPSIYSQPFYSCKTGYKMCARLYLNGDGPGKEKCVSLFFVVMRGEYDALLKWPFPHKVTMMALDQNNKEHVIDAFIPNASSSSFSRPTKDMNIASGCPSFLPLHKLDQTNQGYVKEDTMFIKLSVDLGT